MSLTHEARPARLAEAHVVSASGRLSDSRVCVR